VNGNAHTSIAVVDFRATRLYREFWRREPENWGLSILRKDWPGCCFGHHWVTSGIFSLLGNGPSRNRSRNQPMNPSWEDEDVAKREQEKTHFDAGYQLLGLLQEFY
jgi:hypothetical protein